jgi:hypothetical protein
MGQQSAQPTAALAMQQFMGMLARLANFTTDLVAGLHVLLGLAGIVLLATGPQPKPAGMARLNI